MKFLSLVMVCALLFTLTLTGCGKKVAPVTRANPPTSTEGFGATSGVCSVCKKKSDHLLAIKLGDTTGLVCSQACGDAFRAHPNYYITMPATPAAPPAAPPAATPPPASTP